MNGLVVFFSFSVFSNMCSFFLVLRGWGWIEGESRGGFLSLWRKVDKLWRFVLYFVLYTHVARMLLSTCHSVSMRS